VETLDVVVVKPFVPPWNAILSFSKQDRVYFDGPIFPRYLLHAAIVTHQVTPAVRAAENLNVLTPRPSKRSVCGLHI